MAERIVWAIKLPGGVLATYSVAHTASSCWRQEYDKESDGGPFDVWRRVARRSGYRVVRCRLVEIEDAAEGGRGDE